MADKVSVFWFRRDLRLEDNTALYYALSSQERILPIFIYDSEILKELPRDDARVTFIDSTLQKLNKKLKEEYSSGIAQYYGKPVDVFKNLLLEYNIVAVYANHDYEPYAIKRDKAIKKLLNDNTIGFRTYKDQVIFERDEIVKSDGAPYKVYTPYSKKWLGTFKESNSRHYKSEDYLHLLVKSNSLPQLSLGDINFKRSKQNITPYRTDKTLLNNYEATRNYPFQDGTSKVGPHLRFGTISVRKLVSEGSKINNNTYLKELIWREFFMQILWHFPHTVTQSFKPQYDAIKWRNNKQEFQLWCNGQTGYPLVDAGMRELNTTGFMHNRVRMLVGSFLCKHLLIDWRWGEAYFAKKLHDYELASNVGNWQWVAGCGVDASPYFRIFNPTTQIKKFDQTHQYIHKWVPEYQELTYAKPIVDHKLARERCLRVYKEALNK
jgi:deoxyribodipyrimidine photo-lyase